MTSRFSGGVKPPAGKQAADVPTSSLPRPAIVILPLRQHIGAACYPLVRVGERVARGQPVGDSDAALAAPVHATVSGRVTAIEPWITPSGQTELAVLVETDPEDRWWEQLPEPLGWSMDPEALSPDEIRRRARLAGLVGMGGAGFPTAVKLMPRSGSPVPELVVLNGAECEPLLSADRRLMLEDPLRVVVGLKFLMQTTGAPRGVIAVEEANSDCAAALAPFLGHDPRLRVAVLPSRYPQGAEKMLVWAVARRKVPLGGLPLDVGVAVQNVATAAALATALAEGRPLTERIVTVAGEVASPGNWLVPIGSQTTDLIAAAGGIRHGATWVVMGGPMMGVAHPSARPVPVTKTIGGLILIRPQSPADAEPAPCIRCGRCVAVCPMGLVPAELARLAGAGRWDLAREHHVTACMECGSCAYVCPAQRPLVQLIRRAKAEAARQAQQQPTGRNGTGV